MKKLSLFLILFVGFSACKGDDVEVYQIAKGNTDPAATMPADPPPIAGGMQAPAPSSDPLPKDGTAGLGWTVPAGWTGEGAAGMRLATLRFAGTETTVIALAGTAGGDFPNANRWRGQIGLPPLSAADFESGSSFVQSAAGRVRVLDYKGPSNRLLAGLLLYDGQTWFFKMTGEAAAVEKAKPGFLAFLKSLKPKA